MTSYLYSIQGHEDNIQMSTTEQFQFHQHCKCYGYWANYY